MSIVITDKKPRIKSGIGYKLCTLTKDGRYVSWDHIPHKGTAYSTKHMITDPNWNTYEQSGWHIYLSIPYGFDHARRLTHKYGTNSENFHDLVLVQVEFRQVKVTSYNIVIAKQMRVLEEVGVEEWGPFAQETADKMIGHD